MILNPKNPVFVIGSGGHAKVVIDALLSSNYEIKAILDDDEGRIGDKILGINVIGTTNLLKEIKNAEAVIAIGDNGVRKQIVSKFEHVKWINAVHERAYVHSSVRKYIGEGTIICAGAIIQPDTVIGSHAIINTGATVDHDCEIGSFVHVAPGVNIAGGVKISEGAFIGIGSRIIPNIRLGKWSIIGAGATVINTIPSNATVVGTPAKPLVKNANK